MTDLLPVESASPDETVALGRRLADVLEPGDMVALYGDLGAGKTHLVKGLFAGLGVPAASVSSPTFTLVNEYDGALPVYHFDLTGSSGRRSSSSSGYETYSSATASASSSGRSGWTRSSRTTRSVCG